MIGEDEKVYWALRGMELVLVIKLAEVIGRQKDIQWHWAAWRGLIEVRKIIRRLKWTQMSTEELKGAWRFRYDRVCGTQMSGVRPNNSINGKTV